MQTPQMLKSLLALAGEAGPYVLVGHRLGGQMVLQYAALYPGDMSGLALLDRQASRGTRQLHGRPPCG
jgi:pimeloyl-ACP methyl ester carboxylesterase